MLLLPSGTNVRTDIQINEIKESADTSTINVIPEIAEYRRQILHSLKVVITNYNLLIVIYLSNT